MILAVIPARGGSKRIPRKNIKNFLGKPIIGWSIENAISSNCFDRIIVSTDDEEIADISRQYGADVPFMRSAQLSDDETGTIPVVKDAIERLRHQGEEPDYACCIYATAPLLSAADINRGFAVLTESRADYAFSVTRYSYPIQRALKLNSAGQVSMLDESYSTSRSQDLEESYHDAGQFYWGRVESWVSKTPIFSSNAMAVLLPNVRVQDIDTIDDWRIAEIKHSILSKLAEEKKC